MAKKLFLVSISVAFAATFMLFFSVNSFGKEESIVFLIALLAGGVALAFFIRKNKEVFDELTHEPSEKNWRILLRTLKRNNSKDHSENA